MSRIRHDSYEAERVAILWHQIGTVLSAATVILGLGGVAWHIWATHEHQSNVRTLRRVK